MLPRAPQFCHHAVPTERADTLHPPHYRLEGLRHTPWPRKRGSNTASFCYSQERRSLLGGLGDGDCPCGSQVDEQSKSAHSNPGAQGLLGVVSKLHFGSLILEGMVLWINLKNADFLIGF